MLCSGSAAEPAAQATPDPITAVLTSDGRSATDRERDETDRPAEVLAFIGITPGMQILDLLGGDGYYSELMSYAAGDQGRVYLHNNQGYIGLYSRALQRLRNNRLPTVEPYVRELNDIMLADDSLDLVLLNLVYHDFYYHNNGWEVSVDRLFRVIRRLLKPGGLLVVIDHDAPTGTGSVFAQNLHRIERNFAIHDIRARGFELHSSTGLLQNPADTLRLSVFDPRIRHTTSRFVLKFVATD